MKTNCWLILGTMLATTAVAQVNTNKLPEIPAPAVASPAAPAVPAPVVAPAETETKTNAPAKKAVKAKKKGSKKAKLAAKTVEKKAAESAAASGALISLVPGPATVAAEHANLRGQAGLQGEVVGHAKKGDTVTVLAEITLDKPKAGEPAQWAKISLPTGTKVWINSKYVDTTNKVVAAKKLNLRGGPGENYSVLGVLEKGSAVTSVTTKGDWMQIETPASAFAFVAASLLKQEGVGMDTNMPTMPVVATAENVPPPAPPITPAPVMPATPTTVAEAPAIAPPAATPPPAVETPAPVPPVQPAPPTAPETAAVTPAAPAAPSSMLPTPTLATDETDTNLPPPPPRIVSHEGSVRHSVSPVAPTYYELFDPVNDKAINYLYTSSTNLNLARYNGLHITVTGEESMDVRWKDTPVLTIQKIYVLASDNPKMKPVKAPSPK